MLEASRAELVPNINASPQNHPDYWSGFFTGAGFFASVGVIIQSGSIDHVDLVLSTLLKLAEQNGDLDGEDKIKALRTRFQHGINKPKFQFFPGMGGDA